MTQPAERELPAWARHAAVALVLAGFVVLSFAQRWSVLAASPFPLGVDGYFYPVQLRSLLETGSLEYAASPLAFWLLVPFAAVTDPITGAKLGAALYGALIALPAFAVGAQLARSRAAGIVASALATFSAGSQYLTIEFVKNSIGITVGLTALWLVLRALDRTTRPRLVLAIAGIAAAYLTHKMAAALVLGIAIPAAIAHARATLRGRRLLLLSIGIGVAIVVLVIIGLVAPERFVSPGDVQLVGGLFASEPRWSLPVLAGPQTTLRLGYEPIIAAVLGLVVLVLLVGVPCRLRKHRNMSGNGTEKGADPIHSSYVRGPDKKGSDPIHFPYVRGPDKKGSDPIHFPYRGRMGHRVAAWAIVALAVVIGIPWLDVADGQGLAMRLRAVAFVPLALCAAIVVGAIERGLLRHGLARIGVAAAIVAVVLAFRLQSSRTEGRVVMHPALISGVANLPARVPAGDIVIVPERHIVFMAVWYTRLPIRLRPEPVPFDRRWRLMPLAFIGMGSPLDDELLRARTEPSPPIGLHARHPNGLVLVPEVTWQRVLARLPADLRARYAAWPTI